MTLQNPVTNRRTGFCCVGVQMRYGKFLFNYLVCLIISFLPQGLYALDITPFNTKNQSPFVQIYGLPSIGTATLLSPGQKEIRVMLDYSSNYVDDANAREHIILDGETTRMTVHGRYGLAKNIELELDIPYVIHSGGFLDNFIINYHDLFGFPQGGRDQAPRNRLFYRYARNGEEKIRIDSANDGLGDVSLMAGFKIYHDGKEFPRAVALRTSLKLPTGDSNSLHGSGSTDISCWITASDDYKLHYGHGTVYAAIGFMAMTHGNVLPEQQQHEVGFGSMGAGWSPLSWIALKVQLDAHTPFYKDSQLRELSQNAVQLLIGGTLTLSERTTLDIAVSEDIATLTSPDVVFHFDLSIRF